MIFGNDKLLNTAAAAKLLQSCPTLHDPRDGSPPGTSVHGILQARVPEWGAIAFSELTVQLSSIIIILNVSKNNFNGIVVSLESGNMGHIDILGVELR